MVNRRYILISFSLEILLSSVKSHYGATPDFGAIGSCPVCPGLKPPLLEPSSPNFLTTPVGESLRHDVRFNVHQARKHGGSLVGKEFRTWNHPIPKPRPHPRPPRP
ncbi:hypothetical protein AVEN_127154-1 [Araneus ventricosus]|uniref:Uncharacterized protein n=1 Tax=Araneus ventricosus TaxID=182803 RepID=A0A4Y2UEJ2_ARAVE|nr:hypothetical protein AVEN_127154-1 [Araneus ventricosus]